MIEFILDLDKKIFIKIKLKFLFYSKFNLIINCMI